tara:strand:- start:1208 stop:1477 length:270 start_codon:yes stop_codon:yes gene_type:complete
MSKNKKPNCLSTTSVHKTFRIIKLYDLQITHEVEVPIVYSKEFNYKPMTWSEWEKKYVQPNQAVEEYTSEDTCVKESTDNGEILEIEEI